MLARNFLPAKELGLSDVQRDALIKVLGMLERKEIGLSTRHRETGNEFNMGAWSTCICGWANRVAGEKVFDHSPEQREVRMLFGGFQNLETIEDAATLSVSDVSAKAPRVLAAYLTTGCVNWR